MRILFVLALVVFSSAVFGTAQYPDEIIYNGKKYKLNSNPMESYFEKHPDKRPKNGIESNELYRGYIATFEIKNNQLYLKDIVINFRDTTDNKDYKTKKVSVKNEIFPNQELIKIDWMTGLLVIPVGEIVNYVHMGYGSTYESYILLEINKGNFKQEKQFGYKEYELFKEKQFQAFKKTDEYKNLKAELKKKDQEDNFIDSFLKVYLTEYTSKIIN